MPNHHMKTVWLSIKQHPIPAFCYLFYLFICYGAINNSVYLSRQIKLHPDRGGIANGGEAAALTGGLAYFAGFILLLVCIIRGSSKKATAISIFGLHLPSSSQWLLPVTHQNLQSKATLLLLFSASPAFR
ncbi:MAG: hypothetical protein JKY70_19980 [Mucilaginibacter sp.]|nr:hypothetical protein [Mucilaginibacter sp.]